MKLITVRDTAVTDHFSGERVRLPETYVRISMRTDEFLELEEERSSWLVEIATATQLEPNGRGLNFFVPQLESCWQFFGSFTYEDFDQRHFWSLMRIVNRERFILTGEEAFDFLTLLYVTLAQVMRRGGQWFYDHSERYEVESLPDKWCIAVRVPSELQRMAIGRKGLAVQQVEQLTDKLRFRLSFRD